MSVLEGRALRPAFFLSCLETEASGPGGGLLFLTQPSGPERGRRGEIPARPIPRGVVRPIGGYERSKRCIDFVVALSALVILAPLLGLIALGVKIDSPGSVIFRQERVGRRGNRFIFYKFRSMEVGAEEAKASIQHLNEAEPPLFKMREDPRITRFGRLIRKCAMDELPQLVNVLKGDMSFVGPRPHLPEEARVYSAEQARRLSVIPGITCLWQVSSPSRIRFGDWIEKDLEYVERRSLTLDFIIVLKTIRVVLTGEGMY